jgi:hypothetical protein
MSLIGTLRPVRSASHGMTWGAGRTVAPDCLVELSLLSTDRFARRRRRDLGLEQLAGQSRLQITAA